MKVDCVVPFEEACLVEFHLEEEDKMVFGCFYRSPTQSERSAEICMSLNSLIKSLLENTHMNEESKVMKFINSIQECLSCLYQHVTKPTRCRGVDRPSTIDLIFTEEENQIANFRDHSVLSFEFICEFDKLK